jgi:hypothetical protein
MTSKVIAFLIALLVSVIFAVIGFVVLVLALNGYDESDATYSFGAYGIFAFLLVFALAAIAGGVAHLLQAKEFKPAGTVMIAVITAGALGVVAFFICIVLAVLLAEYFRAYS